MAGSSLPLTYQRVGSMATLFFAEGPIESLDSLADVKTDLYAKFFHALLEKGVAFPPSQYEAFFLSLAHTDADLDQIAAAVEFGLAQCA